MAFSLENSPLRSPQVGVIVTGPDSLIQYASASFSAITGYTAAELHGSDCKRLQGAMTSPLALREIRTCIEGGRGCLVTLVNYRKDGRAFWNRLQIVPLLDANGLAACFLGLVIEQFSATPTLPTLHSYVDRPTARFPWLPSPLALVSAGSKSHKSSNLKSCHIAIGKWSQQTTSALPLTSPSLQEDVECDLKSEAAEIKGVVSCKTSDVESDSESVENLPRNRYQDIAETLSFVAETNLPTRQGMFRVRAYRDTRDLTEPLAIICGGVEQCSNVVCRVHDQCFTSEVLGSLKCDCQAQLEYSMDYIQDNQPGLVIYLPQEGRGMGLANKIKAYSVQEHGFDTVDANALLGFAQDTRRYDAVAAILNELNIKSISLMSNNPRKFDELSRVGVHISSRIPCVVPYAVEAADYLAAKVTRMQHKLSAHIVCNVNAEVALPSEMSSSNSNPSIDRSDFNDKHNESPGFNSAVSNVKSPSLMQQHEQSKPSNMASDIR